MGKVHKQHPVDTHSTACGRVYPDTPMSYSSGEFNTLASSVPSKACQKCYKSRAVLDIDVDPKLHFVYGDTTLCGDQTTNYTLSPYHMFAKYAQDGPNVCQTCVLKFRGLYGFKDGGKLVVNPRIKLHTFYELIRKKDALGWLALARLSELIANKYLSTTLRVTPYHTAFQEKFEEVCKRCDVVLSEKEVEPVVRRKSKFYSEPKHHVQHGRHTHLTACGKRHSGPTVHAIPSREFLLLQEGELRHTVCKKCVAKPSALVHSKAPKEHMVGENGLSLCGLKARSIPNFTYSAYKFFETMYGPLELPGCTECGTEFLRAYNLLDTGELREVTNEDSSESCVRLQAVMRALPERQWFKLLARLGEAAGEQHTNMLLGKVRPAMAYLRFLDTWVESGALSRIRTALKYRVLPALRLGETDDIPLGSDVVRDDTNADTLGSTVGEDLKVLHLHKGKGVLACGKSTLLYHDKAVALKSTHIEYFMTLPESSELLGYTEKCKACVKASSELAPTQKHIQSNSHLAKAFCGSPLSSARPFTSWGTLGFEAGRQLDYCKSCVERMGEVLDKDPAAKELRVKDKRVLHFHQFMLDPTRVTEEPIAVCGEYQKDSKMFSSNPEKFISAPNTTEKFHTSICQQCLLVMSNLYGPPHMVWDYMHWDKTSDLSLRDQIESFVEMRYEEAKLAVSRSEVVHQMFHEELLEIHRKRGDATRRALLKHWNAFLDGEEESERCVDPNEAVKIDSTQSLGLSERTDALYKLVEGNKMKYARSPSGSHLITAGEKYCACGLLHTEASHFVCPEEFEGLEVKCEACENKLAGRVHYVHKGTSGAACGKTGLSEENLLKCSAKLYTQRVHDGERPSCELCLAKASKAFLEESRKTDLIERGEDPDEVTTPCPYEEESGDMWETYLQQLKELIKLGTQLQKGLDQDSAISRALSTSMSKTLVHLSKERGLAQTMLDAERRLECV